MADITYIKLFVDYLDAIEPLGDAERGRLFTSLLEYARSGEAPQLNGNERFLFPMMRAQIDRDNVAMAAKSEERSKAGKLGAEARQANANSAKQSKQMLDLPSKASKDKDNDKDNDNDNDKDNDKDDIGAELRGSSAPPVAELPLNDGSLFPVYAPDASKWSMLYPAVNVLQELRKMTGWLDANPKRRKTKAGIRSFITSWLAREQDRGGVAPARPAYRSKNEERNAQFQQHDGGLSPLELEAIQKALKEGAEA